MVLLYWNTILLGGAEASSSEKNVEKGIVNLVQDASGAIKSVENSQDSSSIKSMKSSIKLMKKLCKMKKKGSEDSNRKTIAKGTGYSNWNHQGIIVNQRMKFFPLHYMSCDQVQND